MDRPSAARLEAGKLYRITLAKPEQHNLPPIFVARFIESRPCYDVRDGHFTGWQAVFEVELQTGPPHRSFGLSYDSFSAEQPDDLASGHIWY